MIYVITCNVNSNQTLSLLWATFTGVPWGSGAIWHVVRLAGALWTLCVSVCVSVSLCAAHWVTLCHICLNIVLVCRRLCQWVGECQCVGDCASVPNVPWVGQEIREWNTIEYVPWYYWSNRRYIMLNECIRIDEKMSTKKEVRYSLISIFTVSKIQKKLMTIAAS